MLKNELLEKLKREINPDIYVMQFSMDGLNHDLFLSMVDSGKLPNIRKHVFDRAVVDVREGRSVFPSVTTYAHEAVITGRLSCHPGLKWFDRAKKTLIDYTSSHFKKAEYDTCQNAITLHEMISPSTTVLEFANRGATEKIRARNLLGKGILYVFSDIGWNFMWRAFSKRYWKENWRSSLCRAIDRAVADRTAKEYLKDPPKLCTSWFLGVDEMAHCNGIDNGILEEAYLELDRHVGKIADAMLSKGIYDRTLLVLFSDHGNMPVRKNMNLETIIMDNCKSSNVRDKVWKIRQDLICTYFGDATGYIYKSSMPWVNKSDKDEIIRALSADESTDFVAKGDGNTICIYTSQGTALFESKTVSPILGPDGSSTRTLYHLSGDNVFGYSARTLKKLIAWHSLDEHLAITYNESHPFILPSILYVFSDNRSPDLMAVAKEGYDYSGSTAHNPIDWLKKVTKHTNLKSADGLASLEGMSVPIIIAGEEKYLNKDAICSKPSASLIDVVPTILDLMGISEKTLEEFRFDGKPIRKRIFP